MLTLFFLITYKLFTDILFYGIIVGKWGILMKKFNLASQRIPCPRAKGYEIANAQGQAITMTDTARKMASLTSPSRKPVMRPVAIAMAITTGTKITLTWSTKR